MSVVKIIEISCASTESFQDAMEQGVARASQTLKGVEGAWIQDQKILIENGKIVEYRVIMKVSFTLTD